MSHRVIQFDSKVSSKAEAESLQQDIKSELDARNLDLHTREVNDGIDLEGNATLAVKTDHNDSTEANNFYDWLWNYAQNSQVQYDGEGNVTTKGFTRARIQVHDCKHIQGLQEPCEIGNADKYDLRR